MKNKQPGKNASKKNKDSMGRMAAGIVTLLISLLLIAYPFISEMLFENRKDSLIETYKAEAVQEDNSEAEAALEEARIYNQNIFQNHVQLQDPFKSDNIHLSQGTYESLLNLQGSGIMGYVSVPCINVELPIYHGTAETILQHGVGHLEGTSLPIGGESTHSVLTGHTGLNNARLFTDLVQVKEGDTFFLYVLNEKLAYQVDQILVVAPEQIESLTIQEGQDYCTLLTCTPYGVNSHRLLVRGYRVPYVEEVVVQEEQKAKENNRHSEWMRQYRFAIFCGMVVVVLSLGAAEIVDRWQRKRKHKGNTRK